MKEYRYSLMFFVIAVVALFGYAGAAEAHRIYFADACKVLGIVSASIGGVVGYFTFLRNL